MTDIEVGSRFGTGLILLHTAVYLLLYSLSSLQEPISLSQVKSDLKKQDKTFFKNKRADPKSKKLK